MIVELLKPHTHAGELFAPGDQLDLDDTSAAWLIAQGAAKAVTTVANSKPARRDVASGVSATEVKGD